MFRTIRLFSNPARGVPMGHLTIVRDDDSSSDLTDRQREVLDFISGSINKCGYPPTLREIGS
ncbi:MAG TPA: hypothetical protein VJ860_09640, partial [Polyangia bacterium]|nr:hypothetical protein [Polyangia bacterium]